MKTAFGILRQLWRAGTFSPAALVLRALVIAALYALSRLLGLQEYTSFLSGTSANLNVSWQTAAILGCTHLLLYVAFIVLAPISLIAAALLLAWERWKRRRGGPPERRLPVGFSRSIMQTGRTQIARSELLGRSADL